MPPVNPTPAQLAARLNPTPFSTNVPGDGIYVTDPIGQAILIKQGNTLYQTGTQAIGDMILKSKGDPRAEQDGAYSKSIGAQYLKGIGVDYSSLPQMSGGAVADLFGYADRLGLTFSKNTPDLNSLAGLFKTGATPGSTATFNTTPNAIAPPATMAAAAELTKQQLAASGASPTQASALASAVHAPTNDTYAQASGYTGTSIVDFLKLAGKPSDFASRTALAGQMGISNYTGTAAQNTQLLDLLKGHNVSVGQNGVPSNVATVLGTGTGGTTAGSTSPIDLSSLSSGGLDLSSILGAGVGKGSGINSDIAGLLSLYGASTTQQKAYEDTAASLTTAMKSLDNESADLQTALAAAGVPEAQKHLQDLSLQAAQLQGTLQSFDAETTAQTESISQQDIPQGLVQGQQAAFQKQRSLTRLSMAAELSATTALMTAYQGNIDTATKLATQAVDMKYAPILNEIQVLQTQLGIAKDAMNSADSKNANIINKLLDIKQSQINDQKAQEKTLQTMGVNAAAAGAPLSLVKAAIATGDPVQASSMLSSYVKGSSSSSNSNSSSSSSSTKSTFTSTQLHNGAAASGMAIDQFNSLDADTQNYFINSYKSSQLYKDIQAVSSGGLTTNGDNKQEVASNIAQSNLPDSVKTIILSSLGVNMADASTGQGGGGSGGFFNFLKPFGGSAPSGAGGSGGVSSIGSGIVNAAKSALSFFGVNL